MKTLVILLSLGLSACALIERDARSGYAYSYDSSAISGPDSLYEQRRMHMQDQAREELGLMGRPLEDNERVALELRIRLKRMEARLATKREKKQYYDIRSHLKNDRERIYFLSLPTYEARERWAASRGLGQKDEAYTEEIAQTIEAKDIALGMTQKAVMESWGDPDAVEVAGNPIYGFERWKYHRYVSGADGYQKEMRIVYFEGGRVVGWERD